MAKAKEVSTAVYDEAALLATGLILIENKYATRHDGMQWVFITGPKINPEGEVFGDYTYHSKISGMFQQIIEDKMSKKLKMPYSEEKLLKAINDVHKQMKDIADDIDGYCKNVSKELYGFFSENKVEEEIVDDRGSKRNVGKVDSKKANSTKG